MYTITDEQPCHKTDH